ncbi:hypothetical protein IMSHALPRED_009391 [Imshaugia aleurites]|uniref:Uncharacterized protein n=1 Tax=Imshaugia aleurites TaxID=172621 RepID=A0A8H3FZL2_9LECA|nr:hypothetical protein IMSHALPRED_009391 [Imshaugia aleurites]
MAHPLDLPSTDLLVSFAGLKTDSRQAVASTQIEQDSKTSAPPIVAADGQEQVGLLTLPREIRDQVYLNLVVAADPIQYDERFETLSGNDTFTTTATMCMFEDASNAQVAQEAREMFYQHNTFLIYTHDIAAFLGAKNHAMSIRAGEGVEPTIHSTSFEVGAWVRKLAVRVGWHASGGWFADECCCKPAPDLRILLESSALRSVIIDARFGAWTYGYPQGIGWDLLKEMNEKWRKEFKIYNDQTSWGDTRRYTSERYDLSKRWLPENQESQDAERLNTESGDDQRVQMMESEEAELWGASENGEEGAEQEAKREDAIEAADRDEQEALSVEKAELEDPPIALNGK